MEMGTPLQIVYDAFFSRMLEDEWEYWTKEEMEMDLFFLLSSAIPWFKFPRKSLEIIGNAFVEQLSNMEVQILANYMKCEWLNRNILTWENIKPLYSERDFSQANLIDKFTKLLAQEKANAEKLEKIYYRSISGKPFKYSKLAGKGDGRN